MIAQCAGAPPSAGQAEQHGNRPQQKFPTQSAKIFCHQFQYIEFDPIDEESPERRLNRRLRLSFCMANNAWVRLVGIFSRLRSISPRSMGYVCSDMSRCRASASSRRRLRGVPGDFSWLSFSDTLGESRLEALISSTHESRHPHASSLPKYTAVCSNPLIAIRLFR